jgi:hypothetical protein
MLPSLLVSPVPPHKEKDRLDLASVGPSWSSGLCGGVGRLAAAREALPPSVGSILGIDSQRLDSLGEFPGRARRLDSKVKESI